METIIAIRVGVIGIEGTGKLLFVWGNSRDCPLKSPILWGFLGLSWIHETKTNNNLSVIIIATKQQNMI